jgi:hypothetical protein
MTNPPGEELTLAGLVEAHVTVHGPDAHVDFGREGRPFPIGLEYAVEAFGDCTADPEDLQDPARNIRYLADRLARSGLLLPQYAHLIETKD